MYLCEETIGADQLRDYHTADLPLCLRISKSRFSHDTAHLFFAPLIVQLVYI